MVKKIYLEIDSDILEVTDLLKKEKAKEVMLIFPKRSTLARSKVNLSIISKIAKDYNMEVIAVTDSKQSRLAAAKSGLQIAASTSSKVYLASDYIDKLDKTKKTKAEASVMNTVRPKSALKKEFSDSDKYPSKKSIKIPSIEMFRKRFAIIFFGLIAVFGFVMFYVILANAEVSLKISNDKLEYSESQRVGVEGTDILTNTYSVIKEENITIETTGEEDLGTLAVGELEITNCEDTNPRNFDIGSTLEHNGAVYFNTQGVIIPGGSFTSAGSVCNSSPVVVPVTASENGEGYNVTGASFTTTELPGNFSISGSLSGGSSDIVQVFNAEDRKSAIDTAISNNLALATEDVRLQVLVEEDMLDETLGVELVETTFSHEIGDNIDQVSGIIKIKYSYLAVNTDDLKTQIVAKINPELELDRTQLVDYSFKIEEAITPTSFNMLVEANVIYIPSYSDENIKELIKSVPVKDVEDILKAEIDNLQQVRIDIWPSFKSKMPRFESKIDIIYEN